MSPTFPTKFPHLLCFRCEFNLASVCMFVPSLLISRDILFFCNILFLDSWSEEDCEELQQSRSRFDGIRGGFLIFGFLFKILLSSTYHIFLCGESIFQVLSFLIHNENIFKIFDKGETIETYINHEDNKFCKTEKKDKQLLFKVI